MESETSKNEDVAKQVPAIKGSVAHHIIGQFIEALAEKKDCEDIANNLKNIVFETKITEADLRKAIFGEDPL